MSGFFWRTFWDPASVPLGWMILTLLSFVLLAQDFISQRGICYWVPGECALQHGRPPSGNEGLTPPAAGEGCQQQALTASLVGLVCWGKLHSPSSEWYVYNDWHGTSPLTLTQHNAKGLITAPELPVASAAEASSGYSQPLLCPVLLPSLVSL